MQFFKLSDYSKETKAHGLAWISLSVAIGIHVFDEAITDFLSFYNRFVDSIRQHAPFLPLPTFTYGVWLAGLIVGIIILLCLSPLVFRSNRWMFLVSYLLGTIMIVNAVAHMAGSVIMGGPMPGVYSSFLLLATAVFLIINARKHQLKSRLC
ncbi:MAG: HXXEE domain-containing protein [Candidatus Zixiibacteriota bacterium]